MPHKRTFPVLGEKMELSGSMFSEAGDLSFIKVIVGELYRRPLTTSDAQSTLKRILSPKRNKCYASRTVWDFLYVCKNLHLITYSARERRKLWKLTPNGLSWVILAPEHGQVIGPTDRVFLLRYLLMLDANNHGLLITCVLKCIEEAQLQHSSDLGTDLEVIRSCFKEKLRERSIHFKELNHKLGPILAWSLELELLKRIEEGYGLSDAGLIVAGLNKNFVEHGYQGFRKSAGSVITQALVRLGLVRRMEESPKLESVFETTLKKCVKEIRAALRTRAPIPIPILRNVCCTRLLESGIAVNDEEFDNFILQLARKYYYKYTLTLSRKSVAYPYPGIEAPRGSFYYFQMIKD